MIIIGNIIGLILILCVIWWFWLAKRGNAVTIGQKPVKIIVNNGVYKPDQLRAKVGQTITLHFLRKSASPCSAVVLFSDLGISTELPIDTVKAITLTPTQAGEFDFTCEMAMYRGKLIIE